MRQKGCQAVSAVLIVFAALQLPFLNSAFRIDDTNILAIARQMARSPLDPYGFDFNWTGTARPAFDILANPPLAPAAIAAWASLFGWSEVSLHFLTLLFALAALLAFFSIRNGLLGTALLASSPAFFIASQAVMPDMLMLALMLVSLAAAIRYRDGRFASLAFAAGFLAPIAKYNAVILVALLLTIAFTARERRRGLFAIAAAPIVGLACWNLFTLWRYGAMHLFVVSEERKYNLMHTFADLAIEGKRASAIDPVINSIVLAGLVIVPLGWQLLLRRRYEWALALGTAAIVLFVARMQFGYSLSSAILFVIGIAAGIRAIVFALGSRNALVIVWVISVLAFQAITFGVAVRYLLPLLPAVLSDGVSRSQRWRSVWRSRFPRQSPKGKQRTAIAILSRIFRRGTSTLPVIGDFSITRPRPAGRSSTCDGR